MSQKDEVERALRDARREQLAHGHDWDVADVLPVVMDLLKAAWNDAYVAGHKFGYEWAQDTYDGPLDDPTTNPYEDTP